MADGDSDARNCPSSFRSHFTSFIQLQSFSFSFTHARAVTLWSLLLYFLTFPLPVCPSPIFNLTTILFASIQLSLIQSLFPLKRSQHLSLRLSYSDFPSSRLFLFSSSVSPFSSLHSYLLNVSPQCLVPAYRLSPSWDNPVTIYTLCNFSLSYLRSFYFPLSKRFQKSFQNKNSRDLASLQAVELVWVERTP